MADLTKIGRIEGLQLQAYASSGSGVFDRVRVSEGLCFLPDNTRLMFDGSNAPAATIPTDLVSTWIHLYAYSAASNIGGLELSTVAPAAPYRGTARTKTGDVTRRYLGSGRIESNGRLRAGRHLTDGGKGNYIQLTQPAGTLTAPSASLSLAITVLGGTGSQTSMDLSTFIPPTANAVTLLINNTTGAWVYIGRPALGALSSTVHDLAVQPNSGGEFNFNLDSDLTLNYVVSTTSLLGVSLSLTAGNVVMRPKAYLFDR